MVIKDIYVFYLYFYTLVFSIINRSFTPFDIDLRYIIIPLGILAIFVLFLDKKGNIRYPTGQVNLAVLLLYMFVIQSFWNIKVQIIEYEVYENVIILNLYNMFNVIVISLYYREINLDLFYKAIKIALTFLGISIILTLVGVDLPYNSYYSLSGASEAIEFVRYCGYGTDPNYVSLFFASFIFIAYDCIYEKKKLYLITIICMFFLILSRSSTVIIVTLFCFFVRVIYKKILGNNPRLFILSMLIVLLGMVFIFFELRAFEDSVSLAIRYGLWERAYNHFVENPWLGNGITSVRCFSFLSESNWFVQVHSTLFQLLCEHGLIALLVYFYIFYRLLYGALGMKTFYAILIYFVWSFSYETMYLGFPIIYFAILPCCDLYRERNKI